MPHPKVSVAKDRTLPKGGERKGANEGGFHLFEAATRDHHGRSRRIEGGAGDTSSHRAPLARRSDCSLFLLQSAGCVGDRRRARQQCRRIHLRKRGRGNEREREKEKSFCSSQRECDWVSLFFRLHLLLSSSSSSSLLSFGFLSLLQNGRPGRRGQGESELAWRFAIRAARSRSQRADLERRGRLVEKDDACIGTFQSMQPIESVSLSLSPLSPSWSCPRVPFLHHGSTSATVAVSSNARETQFETSFVAKNSRRNREIQNKMKTTLKRTPPKKNSKKGLCRPLLRHLRHQPRRAGSSLHPGGDAQLRGAEVGRTGSDPDQADG